MIEVANTMISNGYTGVEIVGVLKFAVQEQRIELDDLTFLVPLLFPEETQDVNSIPKDCDFAKEVDGKFAWKFPFSRIVIYNDFPIECVGTVANAGYRGDGRDLFSWLRSFGALRASTLEPPDDLVTWSEAFLKSVDFSRLLAQINRTEDDTRSVVRYRVIQALRFLPGARSALARSEWQLGESDWNEFLMQSKLTRPFVIWDGWEYAYDH
jgi:hypothetical protein